MKNSYIDLFSSYKKVKYFKKYFGIKKNGKNALESYKDEHYQLMFSC